MEQVTSVKHLANLGDQVSIMIALKKFYDVTGKKIKLLQCINVLAEYYNGATHGTTDSDGRMVTMNDAMFDMMKPLVESQEYIDSYEKYSGQQIDLDFDVIRGRTFVNMPHGMIQSWIMYAYPDLATDISKTWIHLPEVENHPIKEQVKGKVLVNFTERYRNHIIDYFFLKEYADDIIFAGTEREHWLFCQKWQLNVPRLQIADFLEYAYALKYCRFLLSNQSFGWNLATAMGVPRILEVCSYAANCQPFVGEHSYGFYHQTGVKYYWNRLFNLTKK